uniref:Uncharacterized protein n=1 Tax=Anguilla anguilla TaxID=7936 RepID=A0A0E9QEJ5_ANGAN
MTVFLLFFNSREIKKINFTFLSYAFKTKSEVDREIFQIAHFVSC